MKKDDYENGFALYCHTQQQNNKSKPTHIFLVVLEATRLDFSHRRSHSVPLQNIDLLPHVLHQRLGEVQGEAMATKDALNGARWENKDERRR